MEGGMTKAPYVSQGNHLQALLSGVSHGATPSAVTTCRQHEELFARIHEDTLDPG